LFLIRLPKAELHAGLFDDEGSAHKIDCQARRNFERGVNGNGHILS
jgi:hypothetical protein